MNIKDLRMEMTKIFDADDSKEYINRAFDEFEQSQEAENPSLISQNNINTQNIEYLKKKIEGMKKQIEEQNIQITYLMKEINKTSDAVKKEKSSEEVKHNEFVAKKISKTFKNWVISKCNYEIQYLNMIPTSKKIHQKVMYEELLKLIESMPVLGEKE